MKQNNFRIKLSMLHVFLFALILSFFSMKDASASDIKEVLPLTNKVLMVHFDDGNVVLPNTLNVDRLNVTNADNKLSWTITSTNDTYYQTAKYPSGIGRKTKGTEFVRDVLWGGNASNPTQKEWAAEHWLYITLPQALTAGKTYTLSTGTLAANGSTWTFTYVEKNLRSEAVHVNTIGYASNAPKYGYIYQWMGSAGNLDLTAYNGKQFWIYKDGTEAPVKTGTIQKRKGALNAETTRVVDTPNKNFLGAEVYDCNFSDVTAEGTYKLVVEGIGSSYPFKIGKDPIWEAYYNVARSYYYQRSGIRLAPPYTMTGYIRPVNQNPMVTSDDGVSYAGKILYSDFPYVDWANGESGGTTAPQIRAAAEGKPLNIAGWYHDAGDWDAYSTHQKIPMTLMTTWEYNPQRFADNELNIPESGNGIPDIIDEASWLVKFNYRLRKELKAKGYSNGGVGGARVCADLYTSEDGAAEKTVPSWKEFRRTLVSKADAYMTYIYAGQAAQFAVILRKLGKNPTNYQVEMLDKVDFASMTKDNVNWITEAEEAYAWASAPANQPSKHANYESKLEAYKMYAAVNLYRLTGKEIYHTAAKTELAKLQAVSKISNDERFGAYSYLLSDTYNTDAVLQNALKNIVVSYANVNGVSSAGNRALRWGGVFDTPMLVGQATAPAVFETMIAACLTGNQDFKNVVHTTADYFLGGNPMHTSWMTGVGPRPAIAAFHLDSRYNNNWKPYPGWIPYGPWTMDINYTPVTWNMDGVNVQGGAGSWNEHWANFSVYPLMENWPGHERYNENFHAPMSSENTVHQTTLFGSVTYAYVNGRENTNAAATNKIAQITLDKTTLNITELGGETVLLPTFDIANPDFSVLKWSSSNPRVAYVDATGKVKGITVGTCVVTCTTLDGSVVATANVNCSWTEVPPTSISVTPASISIFKGQTKTINVVFSPTNVSNKFIDYTYSVNGIVTIDEKNLLTALSVGTVTVTATSVSGAITTTFSVTVKEPVDHVISDFDAVIPVTDAPKPLVAQIYAPGGSLNIDFTNPFVSSANPSTKVFEFNRSAGDWKLFGIVLPTDKKQDLSQYSQLQFKYYGKDIKDFFIQLMGKNGNIEITQPIVGDDCWKLFTYNLASVDSLKQFNIFVNKTGGSPGFKSYYDDFKLAGLPAVWNAGTTISNDTLNLNVSEQFQLNSNVSEVSWVSSNKAVATVDQSGNVTAVGGGEAIIKAVPLNGVAASCIVNVEGAILPVYSEEVFLDFETIKIDWSAGYGGFGWNTNVVALEANPLVNNTNSSSKVFSWVRDIAGNLWGGCGVGLPIKSTTGWERLSFQVYAPSAFSTIRTEFKNGTVSACVYQSSGYNVPANTWTKITYNLAEIGLADKSFTQILMQLAGGSDVANMKILVDNFKFEKGPVSSISTPKNDNALRLYPNPAKDVVTVSCENGIERIDLYDISGKMVFTQKGNHQFKLTLPLTLNQNSLLIMKVTDANQQVYRRKLMVE